MKLRALFQGEGNLASLNIIHKWKVNSMLNRWPIVEIKVFLLAEDSVTYFTYNRRNFLKLYEII